ncbi:MULTISPECIES: YozQ family protein [Geobacillus]|uniref:Uncharacterized protein n=1 Tax=Geobacillus thermocatenulatus TaxID=33938 RepID=A0A226Q3B8_9BACL|nr:MULTISPECIES: YozQ family protein [Geobacillus]ASS99694.1 hypothetical protein GT3921_12065 [Geobacillus thermocatenulatus]KLR72823.1 hypothetical protein ABH20_14270 [Geobacillus sp. T6]KPD01012.1 hypothetical protein LR69_00793 [Geobacillus sp. BCO2]OXB86099.1 hypothetical protein B9L19_11085 [Geobacillus thermocatenulatus]
MKEKKQPLEITGRQYDPSDYESDSFLGAALSETHEQVSDVYAEGTIEAAVDHENGSDIPLSPRE